MCAPARAQTPEDDELRVYAVSVVKKALFEKEFTGYGIYLGSGRVITAAHVIGNWPLITHPRVLVAGLDLPATIIKQGSLDDTDLALLYVDEAQLPMSLRLRRNPLCKQPPPVGTSVIVVYPEKTVRSHVISPLAISPQYRAKYNSLIAEAEGSGSGVFFASRRCLLGMISVKVRKYNYRKRTGPLLSRVIPARRNRRLLLRIHNSQRIRRLMPGYVPLAFASAGTRVTRSRRARPNRPRSSSVRLNRHLQSCLPPSRIQRLPARCPTETSHG